jgi:hypothetical protein
MSQAPRRVVAALTISEIVTILAISPCRIRPYSKCLATILFHFPLTFSAISTLQLACLLFGQRANHRSKVTYLL